MIYNLLISILLFFLKFVSIFNLRAKTFINTRNNINQKLSNNIKKKDKVLWFHCSSLGEFEQARPLIDYYFNNFSKYKIIKMLTLLVIYHLIKKIKSKTF